MAVNNLLVTMSGGTTSVINATVAGLIDEVRKTNKIDKVYAGCPGILGVFSENLLDITDVPLDVLVRSPGSASIGTTRVEIYNDDKIKTLANIFEKNNIKYFVNIVNTMRFISQISYV